MKRSTLNHGCDDGFAATAIERGVVAALVSVAAIGAISATGEPVFTFLAAAGDRLIRLIDG